MKKAFIFILLLIITEVSFGQESLVNLNFTITTTEKASPWNVAKVTTDLRFMNDTICIMDRGSNMIYGKTADTLNYHVVDDIIQFEPLVKGDSRTTYFDLRIIRNKNNFIKKLKSIIGTRKLIYRRE